MAHSLSHPGLQGPSGRLGTKPALSHPFGWLGVGPALSHPFGWLGAGPALSPFRVAGHEARSLSPWAARAVRVAGRVARSLNELRFSISETRPRPSSTSKSLGHRVLQGK